MSWRRPFTVLAPFGMFTMALGLSLSLIRPTAAGAIIRELVQDKCNTTADAFGIAVATGGDFDGDGTTDLAVAAPCSRDLNNRRIGRVVVYSGATGKPLRRLHGRQVDAFFGTAIAFVGDLNGDGRDEIAVGTPAFDVIDRETFLRDAGMVQVFSKKRRRAVRTILGTTAVNEVGSSIASISDTDGDGIADLAIGATGARDVGDKNRPKGGLMIVSATDGRVLKEVLGRKRKQGMGLTVTNVGRVDGDGIDDVLVTSTRSPVRNVRDSGFMEVISGASATNVLFSFAGAKNDRLGTSAAAAGDLDGDGLDDLIVGAPGTNVERIKRSGIAIAFSATGEIIFASADTVPQKAAGFGTAVAAIGDINGDGVTDFAVSAPLADVPVKGTSSDFLLDAGRIVALSGTNGGPLWVVNGSALGMRMGESLTGGIDYNRDGIPDLISGNPGDTPKGRRGAGTVRILSGSDGTELASFMGRRGLETRLFALVQPAGQEPILRSFGPDGRKAEVRAPVLRGTQAGSLSVSVLAPSPPLPGASRVVVGTGAGGKEPLVNVLAASRRNELLNSFKAFDPPYQGGVNVAGADLDEDGIEDIVAIQADSDSGNVAVTVFSQLGPAPSIGAGVRGWLPVESFPVFTSSDVIDPGIPIAAGGGTVAVGNLRGNVGREIVVGTTTGASVVRVFTSTGNFIQDWLAYDNMNFDGTNVATGDLDGDGVNEIVTAPARGAPWIRAFTARGNVFVPFNKTNPVSFIAFGNGFSGGARIATADVDFDDSDEILVVKASGTDSKVYAFESDGTPVKGWKPFRTMPGSIVRGPAIATTNRFVRR